MGQMAIELWFNSWQGHQIFLFSTVSRPALRATQPPNQWVQVGSFPEESIEGVGLTTDHQLALRLRTTGYIPLLPQHIFIVSKVTPVQAVEALRVARD
jgi:hypothetical protein